VENKISAISFLMTDIRKIEVTKMSANEDEEDSTKM
jgi:hypothetical protein